MYLSTFRDSFLTGECSNLFMWKHETNGSFLMDICFKDSCRILHRWQKNFWSESDPNRSGRVNWSRQPTSVGVSWESIFVFVFVFVFVFLPEGSGGMRSSEMSMHGSYVVEVNPHAVHMTSERRIPENTRCAIQHSPLPI